MKLRIARVLLLATALLALVAPAAAAHAVLEEAKPADEAVVDSGVDRVTLRFNENVGVAFGGTKVWGPDGERVDTGKATVEGGDTVVIPFDGESRGTYALSYRIISADGHPVRGASTFHVGAASEDAESERKANAASEADRPVEVAFGTVRGIALGGLLLLAGGVCFVAAIAPGTRPRLLAAALTAALLALPVSFVLDAMNATGLSLSEVLQADVLRAEADTTWGRSVIVQCALLVVLAAWLRSIDLDDVRGRTRGLLVSIPAFAPLLAWSIGGHAIATEPVWLRLPLDMAHMCAAAIWVGGLVQLSAYLRRGAASIEHVERWSRVALAAVVVLVLSGLYAAWTEVGWSREALADTTYGRLVLAKVLLLVGAMPLAWLNRRHNVPGLRGGRLADGGDPEARLRRYVRGEVAILVLVIAATAALIQTPPARTTVAPPFIDRTLELSGGGEVQVIVDPARTGSNEVHAYVVTADKRIDGDVSDLKVVGSLPSRDIAGYDFEVLPAGPGHYTTPGRTIPFAGTWTFSVTVAHGKFQSETKTFTAMIPKSDS